tara:strand:+ start:2485 stop:3327 length:843 start_codon:yes stop_codon:yes gene_type:complete
MNRFTQKIFLFLFLFILVNIPFYLNYTNQIKSSSPYQLDEKFKAITNPINTLFIGSSHLENAVNSADFNNSFNFSSSGQSYEESFLILKNIVSPSLKKVVLSFSPFNFHQTNKKPILNNTYYEYPLQSNGLLFRYILDYTKYARFFVKPFRLNKRQTEINFVDHAKVKSKIHFKYEKMNHGEQYYYKIIELSKKHGFELIFITTPFSKEYYVNCNNKESWINDKMRITRDAKENDFKYYNFEKIYIQDNSHHKLFRDSDHLNSLGRNKFRDQLYPIIGHN